MLTTMYAALVTCAVSAEPDPGFYYAHCIGRKDLAAEVAVEQVERRSLGGYCQPFEYEQGEKWIDFILRCE